MGFEKGNKIGSGRPKGSKNKTTEEIKEAFQLLLSSCLPQLISDVNDMEAKDRANFLLKLSDKILPSLKSVDAIVESTITKSLGFEIEYNEDKEEDK